MKRLNKRGVTEATIFYIIAIVLGIIVVIVYIILAGPSVIVNSLTSFFSSFETTLSGGFGHV
jgi:hypothetical protein